MAKFSFCLIGLIGLMAFQQTVWAEDTFEKNLDDFHTIEYSELAKRYANRNLIFSPFTTQMSLAMIRMGATNETAREIDDVAKFSWRDSEKIANAFKEIINYVTDSVKLVNKIYIKRNLIPNLEYTDILSDKFYTILEPLDTEDATSAAVKINKWIDSKSKKKLSGGFQGDIFKSNFEVLVVNYVFFEGTWNSAFNPRATSYQAFTTRDDKITSVPMMTQENTYQYAEFSSLQAEALSLDFDGDLSLLILLPFMDSNLNHLTNKLRTTPISFITDSMKSRNVVVSLPKFDIEVEEDLKPMLKNIGLKRIFEHNSQLNNIVQNQSVKITNIVHKTAMKINEEGAKISTDVETVGGVSDNDLSTVVFNANRPFYFAIINSANLVFFAGHIVNA